MIDFDKMQEELKKELTRKRYTHTLGVAYTAAALSMKYGCDIEMAQAAGLLHDCAKCYSDTKLLEKANKYGLNISEIERRNPYLLHGKVGACMAGKKYKIEEKEILSAISCHTTGKPNMNVLEKIIFLADYIEPNRKMIPRLSAIRKMAFDNLDYAVYMVLDSTLSYLDQTNGKEIDTVTVEAYEYYKNIFEK